MTWEVVPKLHSGVVVVTLHEVAAFLASLSSILGAVVFAFVLHHSEGGLCFETIIRAAVR